MRDVVLEVPTKPRPHRGFVVFKWAVYALLALNVGLYAWQGTATEAVDTAAWVALLLLFEWETGGWPLRARGQALVHGVRMAASLVVLWACVAYALAREWLDLANAATWLAVVLALELDVRADARHRRFHRARGVGAWTLYVALAAFASMWVVQAAQGVDGAWLDAWDALLWLAAFVVIELNVFGLASGARPPARSTTG